MMNSLSRDRLKRRLPGAIAAALAVTLVLLAAAEARAANPAVSIFYYPWWGTPARDGAFRHWQQNGLRPPAEIASSFFPLRGVYSSSDPAVVGAHMRELRDAGVDQVITSWWGRGSFEDERLPAVLQAARAAKLKVAAHVEPYPGRTAESVERDMRYLRNRGIAEFYVYQVAERPNEEWARLNARLPRLRIFAQTGLVGRAAAGRFDGIYTYDILAFGGDKLGRLCAQARRQRLLCAPSVGPGYSARRATGDERVKPRLRGLTYDSMWLSALRARADAVTITSYNEWHEGTQIEPARAHRSPAGFRAETYAGAYGAGERRAACAYILRTAQWASAFRARPRRSVFGQPLTTPRGTSCATRRARPARSTT